MAAVNKLQGTAWEINTRVHDVIKEVWRQNLGIGMPAAVPYVAPECPLDPDLKKIDMTGGRPRYVQRMEEVSSPGVYIRKGAGVQKHTAIKGANHGTEVSCRRGVLLCIQL